AVVGEQGLVVAHLVLDRGELLRSAVARLELLAVVHRGAVTQALEEQHEDEQRREHHHQRRAQQTPYDESDHDDPFRETCPSVRAGVRLWRAAAGARFAGVTTWSRISARPSRRQETV